MKANHGSDMTQAEDILQRIWPGEAGQRAYAILLEWCRDLDHRDSYSGQHATLSTEYGLMLARRLCLDGNAVAGLWVAGHVYDLGKIAVPEEVLRRNGPLSPAEMVMMRAHVTSGYGLLKDWPVLRSSPRWLSRFVLDVVLHHHERWDGNGYPKGLVGEDIPVGARITAITDAFSAMILDSPYRQARALEAALREVEAHAGTQFDPYIVPRFAALVRVIGREAPGWREIAGGNSLAA
jgi:HD-GYP domain-containing protein (c-di-GMP phosphodiesterase class II)